VPVVFTPEMEVNLSLEGEVGVSISAGLSQKAHLRVGCIYENGGWSPIYEYNTSFEFTPPKPEFSAWVELSIGPDISFKLYGLVGPYVKPKAYGRAQATLAIEGLDVGLYGGLKVGVGAKFEALGKDIADWEAIEFKVEWPLAEWRLLGNHPPDKASGPRPLDDAVDRPRDTFLSWTGSDPDDGDTLTYDVYLEADVPYPSVKVASDFAGTTFAPEGLLEPNTYYYWRLVARDGSDETTAGPIWSFRTGTSFNSAPFEPSSPTPAHGSGNQPWDVELRWTGGDPDGDAVVYNVYSDISPGPQLGPSQLAHLCVDISEPVCRFQYWAGTRPEMTWMVTARDAHGAEISGPPWTLAFGSNSNHAPNIPSLGGEDGPADGATGLLSHFWLSWTGGDVDDDVVTYDVYMEKDDPTPDLVVCSGPYERCYPGRVDGNATYYWQAQARDEHDAVRLGPVWSFTTRDMVFVAGGPFQMGCDQTNPSARCTRSDELPLHTAQLYDYNIDRVEVTNAQYARCVAANYCEPPKRLDSYTRTSYYDNPAYADFPVVWVDWERARRYCEWAGLRLPTEAEWEKAARGASDTRAYPWGDQEITCDLANYWDVDRGPCVGDTVPATWYPLGASLYGALNMVGNVGEWVNDWYADWYYVESPRDNPQGPSWGQFRVIRGGSWESPYSLTGAHTVYSRSGGDYPANGDFSFGFRCAVTDGW
jgi:formylglycine-generating enzyme required for sulfatase activity